MYRIKFKPFGERTYLVVVLFARKDGREVGHVAGWVTRTSTDSKDKDGRWVTVPANRRVTVKGTERTRALATDRLVAAMAQPVVSRRKSTTGTGR